MAVQQQHLVDGAAFRNQRVGVGQTIVGGRDRVPGTEVSPIFGDVKAVAELRRTMRLRCDQREGLGRASVVWVGGSSLISGRLSASWRRTREANDILARELLAVDARCTLLAEHLP